MIVYSETVVWSPPAELAAIAPYQLVLVEQPEGPRLMGRAQSGERLEIGDTVTLCADENGVNIFRKMK
ncbi:MAG: OB-fold domain-containing protein [Acidobacteria bacterium]|nr:OB-fold domain-containing protein [Acidobacteriota bacterium]